MPLIGIVSDSTASLPEETAKKYDIRIVPLYVKVGDKTYRDRVDITPEEFYKLLPGASPLPTTSQPSAGDFVVVYRELVNQGVAGIISIHLSSGISGTVNSAHLAAEQVKDVPIAIIDTQCAVGAHLLTVEATAQALQGGADFQAAVAVANKVIERQRTVFCLDTLEYLYKGGRIGGAAALVGSLLQFKPLLYFKDGKIDVLERVRKSSRSLARMVEVMQEWLGNEEPLETVVMHADALDRAETLATLVRGRLDVANLRITWVTPVIGTHAGPGTMGLCCCPVSAMRYK
jgi:DegV family protein with EDD domain